MHDAPARPGQLGAMTRHCLIASDGTPLSYGLAGPRDGAPVVLCHGLGAGGAQFAADAQWFAERGFRVLLPDLRGHGQSGMPQRVEPAAFSTARLRTDLYAMLDDAGMGKAHWVGNSLGGILGLGMAQERPEKLASLTIFGTALALSLPTAGWPFIVLDYFPGRKIAARTTARTTTRSRQAQPLIEAMLNAYDRRAIAHIVEHIARYDLRAAALEWAGPAMVLVGARDRAVNRALSGQLGPLRDRPNWRIVELAGGGHCANLDATDQWRDALLAFWGGPAAKAL
jgi:3-oxoadipate enol-lactonase